MNSSTKPISSAGIRSLVRKMGADLCGIAPVERFNKAPQGFSPRDIYNETRSVLVFAKRLPVECLYAQSCIPYTHANSVVTRQVDRLSIELSLALQDSGIPNVPIPSDDPYEHWDDQRQHGRAILSLRHAGRLAGLGNLGRNTLLITPEFGNMVQIGAVLTAGVFDYDDVADYEVCPPGCRICLDSCPQFALDGITVNQKQCRPLSTFRNTKGYVLKKCRRCREACPRATGFSRKG